MPSHQRKLTVCVTPRDGPLTTSAIDSRLLVAIINPFVCPAEKADDGHRVLQVRIELESLTGSKGAFAHVYAPGELEFKDDRVRLLGTQEVSGTLVLKGQRLLLHGRLAVHAEVDCDRCLQPVTIPVEAQFSLEYMTREEYEASQALELEETEMTASVFDGEAIDIDELVREQSLLSVPERILCREDCQGLCPTCGVDRNLKPCSCESAETDPRWAALKNLRF